MTVISTVTQVDTAWSLLGDPESQMHY